MATDGNHGDEGHELLKVAFRVGVGVQAFHQTVHCSLIFHLLSERKEMRDKLEKFKSKRISKVKSYLNEGREFVGEQLLEFTFLEFVYVAFF